MTQRCCPRACTSKPAILGFALEQSPDGLAKGGYASVYRVAMMATLIVAIIAVSLLVTD